MSNPKAFISYAWTSPAHMEWVLQLASDLRDQGVDAILDKWDLKEGHDANAFMEKMVTDPSVSKVIMICDEAYCAKADARTGGVGTEAQIISPRLYAKSEQDKFVAVARQQSSLGKVTVPVFYGSRIHIDMSDDDLYATNFEQLLRWIFNKPSFPKPPIGPIPDFLEDETQSRIGSHIEFRAALDALKRSAPNAQNLVEIYFERVSSELETLRFRHTNQADEYEKKFFETIDIFSQTRNEISELVSFMSRSLQLADAVGVTVKFLEKFLGYHHRPSSVNTYSRADWDNYKFLLEELFVHIIANSLKRERFEFISGLLDAIYYDPGRQDATSVTSSFISFKQNLSTLNERNRRLQLNRLSLKADTLKERCSGSGTSFEDYMQADLLLFLRSEIEATRTEKSVRHWYPETLVYAVDRWIPFEIFARSTSKSYFDRIRSILSVDSLDEFKDSLKKIAPPKFQYDHLEMSLLINLNELGIKK